MPEEPNQEMTYVDALQELKELVEKLSNEQDIDQLAKEVSRAKVLIDFCRSRITNAELEIDQIMSDDSNGELV